MAAVVEVLGRVVARPAVLVLAPFPALPRLIEFATELREAPELDLLRFSFELVGRLVGWRLLTAELVVLRGV